MARSVERIHRSNLIGMGVLPMQFRDGQAVEDLNLDGSELLDFVGLDDLRVGDNPVLLVIRRADGEREEVELGVRIDSQQEIRYLRHGGVLPYVVRKVVARTKG